MADAQLIRNEHDVRKTAAAAIASGEIHQLANGLAGYYVGLNAAASGDSTSWKTDGQVTVTKTTSQVWIDGMPIYWDHSANSATCLTPTSDRDFYLGTAVGDATSAATSGAVNLNKRGEYVIDLRQGVWTAEATNGLGVTPLVGGGVQLAFDAVAEAAQAAIYSQRTMTPGTSNWVMEGRIAVFDGGDNAALDIDVGMANSTHATDLESVAEFAVIHFDGNSTNIAAMSDDGTTDVAATDTTIDYVDDTYFDFVIDARTHTDIQFYINGVLALDATTFTLSAASSAVRAIFMIEKTSDDTPADVRLDFLRVRIAEQ